MFDQSERAIPRFAAVLSTLDRPSFLSRADLQLTFVCRVFEVHRILKLTARLRLNGTTQFQSAVLHGYIKRRLSLCCLQIIIQPTYLLIVLIQD